MTLVDIDTSKMKFLKITDFENIFNIYLDKNGNYFYNLNNSLYFNIIDDLLEIFICDYDMYWPLISYKIYGTTRLAWLLLKLNNINSKDIFKIIFSGTKIKFLPKDIMNGLIATLNNINN